MFKTFLCLKTKQNTEMSNEEHSDSELFLTKLKQAEILEKLVLVILFKYEQSERVRYSVQHEK